MWPACGCCRESGERRAAAASIVNFGRKRVKLEVPAIEPIIDTSVHDQPRNPRGLTDALVQASPGVELHESASAAPGRATLARLALGEALHEHAVLLGLVAAYVAGVAIFLFSAGHWDKWVVRWFYVWFDGLFAAASCVWLLAFPGSRRIKTIAGAAIVGLLAPPVQSTFNSVKQVIDETHWYSWDARFADIDRSLHFGRHPWEWLEPVIRSSTAIHVLDAQYLLWFPVLFGFVIWLAWTSAPIRGRAAVATLLVWILCGNIAAILFSSAGPCYYGSIVRGDDPYAALMALLDSHNQSQMVFARLSQSVLWNAMQSNAWLPFGGISAMPSLHVAMTVLIALIAWQQSKSAGVVMSAFALLTLVGSVALGWHYAIDGYAGAMMALVIWRCSLMAFHDRLKV